MNITDMARSLGRKGGRARAARLSTEDRKRIASMGGKARLESLRAARRMVETLRYAAAVEALQARAGVVERVNTFEGPLPSIGSEGK